jgi:hypothetical protein
VAQRVTPPLKAVDTKEFPLRLFSHKQPWTDATAEYLRVFRQSLIDSIPQKVQARMSLVKGNARGALPVISVLHKDLASFYPRTSYLTDENMAEYYWVFPMEMIGQACENYNKMYAARCGVKHGVIPLDGSTRVTRMSSPQAVAARLTPNVFASNAPRMVTLKDVDVHGIARLGSSEGKLPSNVTYPCSLHIKQYKGKMYLGMPDFLGIHPGFYKGCPAHGDTGRLRNGVFYYKPLNQYFVDFWVYMHANWKSYALTQAWGLGGDVSAQYALGLPVEYLQRVYNIPNTELESLKRVYATTAIEHLDDYMFYELNCFIPAEETLEKLLTLARQAIDGYTGTEKSKYYKNPFTEWFTKEWFEQTRGEPMPEDYELILEQIAQETPNELIPKRKYVVWTEEQDDVIKKCYTPGVSSRKVAEIRSFCEGRSTHEITLRAAYLLKKMVLEQHIFDYARLPHNRYSAKTKRWVADQEAEYRREVEFRREAAFLSSR